jgi:hypothetical protein
VESFVALRVPVEVVILGLAKRRVQDRELLRLDVAGVIVLRVE